MKLEKVACLFFTATVLCFVGCGGNASNDLPNISPVSGIVTMDQQPLKNATVTFTSEKGQVSVAITDEKGNYELSYGAVKGAEVGNHKVTIETTLEGPPEPDYKDPIPAIYNSKSTLTATVKKEDSTPIHFELKSK